MNNTTRLLLALAIIMPIVAAAISFGGNLWADSNVRTVKSVSEIIVYQPGSINN